MAMQFCDSFDHYPTAYASDKYGTFFNNPTIVAAGRYGQGMGFTASSPTYVVPKGIYYPASSTLVMCTAMYSSIAPVISSIIFRDQDNSVGCYVTASGSFGIFDTGGTNITSAAGTWQPSTWQYVTFVYNLGTKSSQLYLGFNASPICTGNLVNGYNNSGSNKVVGDYSGGFQGGLKIDDLVMMDGTGPNMNGFQGDMKVLPYYVDANGSLNQWTPSAGSSYQNVDNQAAGPNATAYNQSSTINQVDEYALGPTPGVTNILAAQAVGFLTASALGGVTAQMGISQGGAANFTGSANFSLGTSGAYYLNPLSVNPITTLPFTLADLATLQVAVKATS